MFISTIILLIPFLMVAFLPLALERFSSDELDRMGFRIEGSAMGPTCESHQILLKANILYGNA